MDKLECLGSSVWSSEIISRYTMLSTIYYLNQLFLNPREVLTDQLAKSPSLVSKSRKGIVLECGRLLPRAEWRAVHFGTTARALKESSTAN